MTTSNIILQLLQTENSDCIDNKRTIIKLLEDGELDKFICKLDKNQKIKLINFKLFNKNILNGIEQFVINLDAFISYYSEQLLIGESYRYVLASIFLKSKYSNILLSKIFIYDGGVNQKKYYFYFRKMMTEQFLNNLMIMRIYIYQYLKYTNIYLERLNYSDKSYNLVFELLVSLFFTNRLDLLVIISNMLINIHQNYIFQNKCNEDYLDTLGIIWQNVFDEFQKKFYYVIHLNNMKYLKYSNKNNLVNNKFYNVLLRSKSVSSNRIQTMIIDKLGNIIHETNPKYIKARLKCVIFEKEKYKKDFRLSILHFKDGNYLKQNIHIFPICNFNYVDGYLLFVLPDKTIDDDIKYINLFL